MPNHIELFDVSLRDGLQALKDFPSLEQRLQVCHDLLLSGIHEIELGSFVSPKQVPAMACSPELFQATAHYPSGNTFSALIPNQTGFELALMAGVKHMAFICAASDQFCRKNMNCSFNEAIDRAQKLAQQAEQKDIPYRVYISCAFYDPWSGLVSLERLRRIVQSFPSCESLVFADTTGVATKEQIRQLCPSLKDILHRDKIALHLHGKKALENAHTALHCGIRKFDSALNGLGGCPYAPNSPGNINTRDLVDTLLNEGFTSSVNLHKLSKAEAGLKVLPDGRN